MISCNIIATGSEIEWMVDICKIVAVACDWGYFIYLFSQIVDNKFLAKHRTIYIKIQ